MMRRMQAAFAAMMIAALSACSGGGDSTTEPPPPPPPPASVASVQITPANPSLYVGRTMSLQAILKDANGNTINGRTVTWTSSDAGKASVNGNGVVTGVAVGEAVITATSEGKSAQSNVSVSIAPVAKVVIENFDTNIALGARITLTAKTYDDKDQVLTGRPIVWSSDKPQVATIDVQTGELTAVSGGQAHISAVSETRQTSVIVNVRVPVASVQVTTALDTLEAYDVVQLAAVTRDANNNVLTGRTITWQSSDPAIATVNPNTGELTGLDRGTVTVTATSEGKQGIAKRVVVIKYRSISAGTMHACDIASGGIAWCWGLNGAEGRIGDADVGNNKYVAVPVKVPGNHKFTQLNTFGRHTCAIDTDAKAWCWGTNSWGSLGTGTNIAQSFTPVAVAGGHKFLKVSAGSDHSCGITVANQLYCWGNNDWRQLGTGNNTIANAPVAVNIPEAVKDVATGAGSTCAVGMSSKAYCWGANSIGQVGDGQKIAYGNVFVALPSVVVGGHQVSAIDASQQFACALNTVGAAYCWGSNQTKLGNGPQGTDTSTPVAVSGGLSFVSLSTGFTHSCAITANADLYCWGSNGNGQLGIAGTHSYVPVKAANNMKAAEVAASGIGTGSGSHTCAISQDRLTAKCWGRNDVGQLGNNETTAAAVKNDPVIVIGQKPLPSN